MRIEEFGDTRVQFLDADGPVVSSSNDTSDLIGNAWYNNVGVIVIPVSRLDPDFFILRSLLAGEIVQKLVNYRLKLVVVGDIEQYIEASDAFRDFVWESNRGEHVWFVADEAAIPAKLGSQP